MPEYPPQLKIGAHDYTLVFAPHWEGSDEELAYTKYEDQKIVINSDLSNTQKVATLLHEAMHVMNHTMSHELHDSLAEQIGQFLIDNDLIHPKLR